MAFARDTFTASGGQTDYTISFPYVSADDILVYSEGVLLTATTDYTLPNATTVRLVVASTASDPVVIQRKTSHSTRTVDFTAGTLTEADLDGSAIQVFYMVQEALDIADLAGDVYTVGDTAPVTPENGYVWYDTEVGRLYVYYTDGDSGQWVEMGGTYSTAAASALGISYTPGNGSPVTTVNTALDELTPMTTQGDVIYGGASGLPTRLAKGTAAQVLAINSGATAPEWTAATPMTTQGDIIYGGASGLPTRLAKGTAAQTLVMNAGATAPEWVSSVVGDGYGFSVANGTDADHDLNIGAGQCWDSTYAELITYSAATIICDANWSGAWWASGNLDTGSIPADDVLYLYVTHDASQANSIVVCSLSATWAGVAKQAGFTLGRRIGAVATDASSNIRGFTENAGEYFLHDRIAENADASTVSFLWRNVTLPHAPVNSVGHIEYFMGRNGPASVITLYLAVTGAVNALTTAQWSNSTFGMYFRTVQSHIHVDSSQQIKVAEDHNGSSTIARTVYLLGWSFPNRFME